MFQCRCVGHGCCLKLYTFKIRLKFETHYSYLLLVAQTKDQQAMIKITRLAIEHVPPSLLVEYTKDGFDTRKLHKRITFRQGFLESSDNADNISQLIQAYPELNQVSFRQLERLFQCLKDNSITNMNVNIIKNIGDLNKVSEEQLQLAKDQMEVTYQRVQPGDANYEYDKRVDFEAESDSSWD